MTNEFENLTHTDLLKLIELNLIKSTLITYSNKAYYLRFGLENGTHLFLVSQRKKYRSFKTADAAFKYLIGVGILDGGFDLFDSQFDFVD